MHDAFQPLAAQARPLGNTSRKDLRTIEREYLAAPARMLGCEGRDDSAAADVLFVEAQEPLAESAEMVDRIVRDVAGPR